MARVEETVSATCRATTLAVAAMVVTMTIGAPAWADRASAHYHDAMVFKRAGATNAAIKALKEAIGARDGYAAAHYSIGILYRKKGDHGKAVEHLEQAAKLDGNNGQIQYSLGLAYFRAGRKADALRTLARAAQLSPKDDRILAQVGVLYIRKDPIKAIEFLKKAIKAKPGKADHMHQLGLAYRKATTRMTGAAMDGKRKRYLWEAKRWLTKAAAKKEDANLEFDLGVLYRRLEKTDKAITHYENAVRLNPRLTPAYWDLGHMYRQAKRNDEAIDAFRSYLRHGGKDRSIANKRIKEIRQRR